MTEKTALALFFYCLPLIMYTYQCSALLVSPTYSSIAFPNNQAYINTHQLMIIGTLFDDEQQVITNESVEIFVNSISLGTTLSNMYGHFYFPIDQQLPDGTYEVAVACSTTTIGPNHFTIDTVPPLAPTITTPTEDEILTTNVVILAGTTEPDAMIELFIDEDTYGQICYANETGNWATEYSFESGRHQCTAQTTNNANNQSPLSDVRHFIVDTLVS